MRADPRIQIDEMTTSPGTWRAVIRVPWCLAHFPGVSGGGTEEGPWVAGTGGSPDMALCSAFENVGRAVSRMPLGPVP